MNRNQPIRQYTNQAASGTVHSTLGRKDTTDLLVDRVMMIAQRLVEAENTIKAQATEVQELKETISKLETKIENIGLKAAGKEFKKPTTTTRRKPTTES